MLMASALMNHCVGGRSAHHGYTSKKLAWNHSVIKGKQFLPRERVASTGWQITRAVEENSSNDFHPHKKTKWWETDIKANIKNIKSQQDLDEQLEMAGDNLTVVHFFSPSCPACKALHPKVHQFADMHPELLFLLINYDEHREIAKSHNVFVLPMFRFYRGAEGRIYSFSCTITTIHKFKDALKRHGVHTRNPATEKGLAEFELGSFDSSIDIPNENDSSQNMDEGGGPIPPSNENMDEDGGPITHSNE